MKAKTIEKPQPSFDALGNRALLERPGRIALFCSNKCPGDIILKCQDWANGLIGSDTVIISGFHTPVERDCLRILLRGKHPTVICPARSLAGMRLPPAWKKAVESGTLCLATNLSISVRRVNIRTGEQRNCFAASLAESVLIPYAASGSKTESLAKTLLNSPNSRHVVYTFASPYTENLLALGCKVMDKPCYDERTQ